jgi:four helix bundle protein
VKYRNNGFVVLVKRLGLTGRKLALRGRQKIKDKRKKIKVEERKNDLSERLFEFAVRAIIFLKTLPYTPENKIIRTQLSKSACSSGANYEEAQSGSSKPDFANKVRISLREMRESNYWLRIIKRTVNDVNDIELDYLIKESGELKSILGSIVQKMR